MSNDNHSPDLAQITAEIKHRPVITEFLEPARVDGFCCFGEGCHSGRGKNGTGAKISKDGATLHCFSCGRTFTNIDIIAHHLGLSTTGSDFIEILKFGCDYLGICVDWGENYAKPKGAHNPATSVPPVGVQNTSDPRELELIRADIASARNFLDSLPVTARRGLTLDTLKHFGCGFLGEWNAPKSRLNGKTMSSSRRLIVPTSDNHYLASAIDRDKVDNRWWKMHAGTKEIFNLAAVHSDFTCVVVEGEIDAMSIWQATNGEIPVIAIGGAAEKSWIDTLDRNFSSSDKPSMLILFDDDDTGRKDAPILRDELLKHGYPAVFDFLPALDGSNLDANEVLQHYGEEKLSELVRNASKTHENALESIQIALRVLTPIQGKNTPKMPLNRSNTTETIYIDFQNESDFFLHNFEENIARRRKFADRNTGFSNLDTEDKQIFLPGVYVLGGLPSIGKTTFAWQLLEQCADAGEHCLYISYEMSLAQLRSKTLARELWRRDKHTSLTAAQISMGGTSATLRDIIAERQQSTRDFRAVKFTFEGINELLPALDKFCASLDKPPIIAIDYLQRMPFSERDKRDGISNNIRSLKDWQLKNNATVIALSSLNRDNYSAPISFESFKETGEIEYSADVMWGLQLYCVNRASGKIIEDRMKFEEARKESPRQMQLKCIKNREGNTYDCFFQYFSAHDHFEPCDESAFNKIAVPPTTSYDIYEDKFDQ